MSKSTQIPLTLALTERAQTDRSGQKEQTNKQGREGYIVTSGLHAQAERINRQTEERGLHPVESLEASTKIRERWVFLKLPQCDRDGVGEVK